MGKLSSASSSSAATSQDAKVDRKKNKTVEQKEKVNKVVVGGSDKKQKIGGGFKKETTATATKKIEKKIKTIIKKGRKQAGRAKSTRRDSVSENDTKQGHQQLRKKRSRRASDEDEEEEEDHSMDVDDDYRPSNEDDTDTTIDTEEDDEKNENEESEEEEDEEDEEENDMEEVENVRDVAHSPVRDSLDNDSKLTLSKKPGRKSGRILPAAAAAAAATTATAVVKKKYAEPEFIDKLENINFSTREEQVKVFGGKKWNVAETFDLTKLDLDQWQNSNSSRGAYFFGEDRYIYPNFSTMKKFIESMRKGDDESIILPFTPMEKEICANPRITVGISGVRHIQKAGGLAVWPVFYVAKEQYNDNNKNFNTKVVRTNFPLYMVDKMTEGLMELCKGLQFDVNA